MKPPILILLLLIIIIIYTLFSLFLCNTEKKLALDWTFTSFLRNILITLQDIHVKLHYNTTHFYGCLTVSIVVVIIVV